MLGNSLGNVNSYSLSVTAANSTSPLSSTSLTDYVLGFNSILEGGSFLSPFRVGEGLVILDNENALFTPGNGHLATITDIGKVVTVGLSYASGSATPYNSRPIFGKVTEKIFSSIDGNRTVTLRVSDASVKLKDKKLRFNVELDKRVDDHFSDICGSLSISYDTEVIGDIIPYSPSGKRSPDNTVQKLLDYGHHYFAYDGGFDHKLMHRNRGENGITKGEHSEYTSFSSTKIHDDIYNYVEVVGKAKVLDTDVSTVYHIAYPSLLIGNDHNNVWFDFFDYRNNDSIDVVSASLVSFSVNEKQDGTGADYTDQCSLFTTFYGETCQASLYVGVSVGYLTEMIIEGYALRTVSNIKAVRESTTSQNSFGERRLTLESEIIRDMDYAVGYAEFLRDKYSEARDKVVFSLTNNIVATGYNVFDVITVIESYSGINADFIITAIETDFEMSEKKVIKTISAETYTQSGFLQLGHTTYGTLNTADNILIF